MERISGIYKLVNPNGKIYIGQSIDIKRRFSEYRRKNCKDQRKLYHSLLKYGWENHQTFILEIVESDKTKLIERENYWKDYYRVFEIDSLCLRKDGAGGFDSEETKLLKSRIRLGHKDSEETKKRKSESAKISQNNPDTKEKKSISLKKVQKEVQNREDVKYKKSESGKIAQNRPETKLKKSLALKGKIIDCPQCGKIGGVANMKRYHFDNCKHKPQ